MKKTDTANQCEEKGALTEALLEKMEREKLDALIRAEIEPAEDNCRFSKRLLGYCQLMKDRK